MSDQQKLPTITIIDYKGDQTVTITCRYVKDSADELPNILYVDIAETNFNFNGTQINQGNLLAFVKNYPDLINLQVDDNGHLILFLTLPEENHYLIHDEDGKLLYEKQ